MFHKTRTQKNDRSAGEYARCAQLLYIAHSTLLYVSSTSNSVCHLAMCLTFVYKIHEPKRGDNGFIFRTLDYYSHQTASG